VLKINGYFPSQHRCRKRIPSAGDVQGGRRLRGVSLTQFLEERAQQVVCLRSRLACCMPEQQEAGGGDGIVNSTVCLRASTGSFAHAASTRSPPAQSMIENDEEPQRRVFEFRCPVQERTPPGREFSEQNKQDAALWDYSLHTTVSTECFSTSSMRAGVESSAVTATVTAGTGAQP